MNRSDALVALAPPGVVTITSTVPAPPGETAVIEVAELTVKLAAGFVPNLTAVAPMKFVPVMLTEVAPAVGPELGSIDVTVGPLVGRANTYAAPCTRCKGSVP